MLQREAFFFFLSDCSANSPRTNAGGVTQEPAGFEDCTEAKIQRNCKLCVSPSSSEKALAASWGLALHDAQRVSVVVDTFSFSGIWQPVYLWPGSTG